MYERFCLKCSKFSEALNPTNSCFTTMVSRRSQCVITCRSHPRTTTHRTFRSWTSPTIRSSFFADCALFRMSQCSTFRLIHCHLCRKISEIWLIWREFQCLESTVTLRFRTLIARNNLLEHLPKAMQLLENMEHLYLSGNRLAYLPPVVMTMKKLKTLHLGGNFIDQLPYTISTLESLTVLYLGGNRLREIPASIGCLYQLENLGLCDNVLETIPSTLGDLDFLETLTLHNNKLRVSSTVLSIPYQSIITSRPFQLIFWICGVFNNCPSVTILLSILSFTTWTWPRPLWRNYPVEWSDRTFTWHLILKRFCQRELKVRSTDNQLIVSVIWWLIWIPLANALTQNAKVSTSMRESNMSNLSIFVENIVFL